MLRSYAQVFPTLKIRRQKPHRRVFQGTSAAGLAPAGLGGSTPTRKINLASQSLFRDLEDGQHREGGQQRDRRQGDGRDNPQFALALAIHRNRSLVACGGAHRPQIQPKHRGRDAQGEWAKCAAAGGLAAVHITASRINNRPSSTFPSKSHGSIGVCLSRTR